jgi:hypothetical protein
LVLVVPLRVLPCACYADGRCYIIPNQQLYALPITQYKRSKNYAVNVSAHLDFCTPAEKIIMLREKVYEWMKQDSAPWYAALSLSLPLSRSIHIISSRRRRTLGCARTHSRTHTRHARCCWCAPG